MNVTVSKVLELAAEYRAEGKRLLALADDIEIAARKAMNETGIESTDNQGHRRPRLLLRKRGKANGYLAIGMEVLRDVGHPMHVTEMLPKISEKMGKQVQRANVEGALVRGLKHGKLKRPRPSTYALA